MMLPRAASSITCPAVRTTKSWPTVWSNTISGGTRESEQETITANGLWLVATCSRSWARLLSDVRLPATNRLFPSSSNCSPWSAGTLLGVAASSAATAGGANHLDPANAVGTPTNPATNRRRFPVCDIMPYLSSRAPLAYSVVRLTAGPQYIHTFIPCASGSYMRKITLAEALPPPGLDSVEEL